MRRPRFHHRPALFKKVSAVIGSLRLVHDRMSERTFGNVAGKAALAGLRDSVANSGAVSDVTQVVNGGQAGYTDRLHRFNKIALFFGLMTE